MEGSPEVENQVKEPEQKLTRQQKRMVERANEEANAMHKRLVNQFAEFFMDSDPAGDEVEAKQREVNAKWRVYCKTRHLTPEVYGLVDLACNQIREQFNNELNGDTTPPAESVPAIP